MQVNAGRPQSKHHCYKHLAFHITNGSSRQGRGEQTRKCRLESIQGLMGSFAQELFRNASAILLLFSLHRIKITGERNPVFCTATSLSNTHHFRIIVTNHKR